MPAQFYFICLEVHLFGELYGFLLKYTFRVVLSISSQITNRYEGVEEMFCTRHVFKKCFFNQIILVAILETSEKRQKKGNKINCAPLSCSCLSLPCPVFSFLFAVYVTFCKWSVPLFSRLWAFLRTIFTISSSFNMFWNILKTDNLHSVTFATGSYKTRLGWSKTQLKLWSDLF